MWTKCTYSYLPIVRSTDYVPSDLSCTSLILPYFLAVAATRRINAQMGETQTVVHRITDAALRQIVNI